MEYKKKSILCKGHAEGRASGLQPAAGWVFGAGTSFRVGWRIAWGGLIAIFQGVFATIGGIFNLAGGLGAGLSSYGV